MIMFETPRHYPRHPDSLNHTPARLSPLGPRNVIFNSLLVPSRCSLSPLSMATDSTGSNKPSNGACQLFSGKENINIFPQQQKQSFSPSESTPPKNVSSFERRFKSETSNPLNKVFGSGASSSSSSARAAQQREVFLNKVKRDRDTGRLNTRGDRLMMMECLSEQKQWDETMRKDATGLFEQYHLDEEEPDDAMQSEPDPDQHALDEFISQDQGMDEAFLEEITAGPAHQTYKSVAPAIMSSPNRSDRSSFYGDDDVDYDDIFMDLAGDQIAQSQDIDMNG